MRFPAATNSSPWCLLFALLAVGCGRTPLLSPSCQIEVAPSAVDFGEVPPGETAVRSLHMENRGGAACSVAGLAIAADADAGFALVPGTATAFAIGAHSFAQVELTFGIERVSVPLERNGRLLFATDDTRSAARSIAVPLSARVRSECTLAITPTKVDFGQVTLGETGTAWISLRNAGEGLCDIREVRLAPGSDPQFSILQPGSTEGPILPGQSRVLGTSFHATDATPPHHRTAELAFVSTDPKRLSASVPLSADIDIGCELTWTPTQLDFGLVILNNQVRRDVTLGNQGTGTCQVTGIAIAPDSDPNFALDGAQARSLSVAPGGSATVRVLFDGFDSAPPHAKTGTLVMQTGDRPEALARIPLVAYVSTDCIEASRWVYTVDEQGRFSRFDPAKRTFTDIGTLACPTRETPNSMAVDHNAVAWVGYQDGNLFKVDTQTGKCEATGFVRDQHGLHVFGMGFVFDPATGEDTLYIAGGPDNSSETPTMLATVSFPSLVVTPIGPVVAGNAELTGTGDGELWGFVPSQGAISIVSESVLARIDPTSGKSLESYTYQMLTESSLQSWAVKFWGGSFWIFLNDAIYEVPRANPEKIATVMTNTGRRIVGAGVSTCAPVE